VRISRQKSDRGGGEVSDFLNFIVWLVGGCVGVWVLVLGTITITSTYYTYVSTYYVLLATF
jgi:hypothetical protein